MHDSPSKRSDQGPAAGAIAQQGAPEAAMKTPEQPRLRSGFAMCSSDLDTPPQGRRGPDQTPTGSATPKECVSMIEALERVCQQEQSPGLMKPGGMDAWLNRAGVADALHTPARKELQQVWSNAVQASMLQGQLQSRVEAELDLATNEAEEHALGYAMLEEENSRLVDIIQGLQQRLAAAEAAATASSVQQATQLERGTSGSSSSGQRHSGQGPGSSAAAGAELVRAAEAVLAKAQQLQQAANTDLEGSLQQLQAAEQQLAAAQATSGSPPRQASAGTAAAAAPAPPAEASVPAGSLLQAQQQVLDALGTASRASQQLQAALNDNHALQQQLVELRAAALQQQGSGTKLTALCDRLQAASTRLDVERRQQQQLIDTLLQHAGRVSYKYTYLRGRYQSVHAANQKLAEQLKEAHTVLYELQVAAEAGPPPGTPLHVTQQKAIEHLQSERERLRSQLLQALSFVACLEQRRGGAPRGTLVEAGQALPLLMATPEGSGAAAHTPAPTPFIEVLGDREGASSPGAWAAAAAPGTATASAAMRSMAGGACSPVNSRGSTQGASSLLSSSSQATPINARSNPLFGLPPTPVTGGVFAASSLTAASAQLVPLPRAAATPQLSSGAVTVEEVEQQEAALSTCIARSRAVLSSLKQGPPNTPCSSTAAGAGGGSGNAGGSVAGWGSHSPVPSSGGMGSGAVSLQGWGADGTLGARRSSMHGSSYSTPTSAATATAAVAHMQAAPDEQQGQGQGQQPHRPPSSTGLPNVQELLRAAAASPSYIPRPKDLLASPAAATPLLVAGTSCAAAGADAGVRASAEPAQQQGKRQGPATAAATTSGRALSSSSSSNRLVSTVGRGQAPTAAALAELSKAPAASGSSRGANRGPLDSGGRWYVPTTSAGADFGGGTSNRSSKSVNLPAASAAARRKQYAASIARPQSSRPMGGPAMGAAAGGTASLLLGQPRSAAATGSGAGSSRRAGGLPAGAVGPAAGSAARTAGGSARLAGHAGGASAAAGSSGRGVHYGAAAAAGTKVLPGLAGARPAVMRSSSTVLAPSGGESGGGLRGPRPGAASAAAGGGGGGGGVAYRSPGAAAVRTGSKGPVVVASGSAAKGSAARASVKPGSNMAGARVTPVVPKLNFSALWSMAQEEADEEGLMQAPRAAQQGAMDEEDVDLGMSSPAAAPNAAPSRPFVPMLPLHALKLEGQAADDDIEQEEQQQQQQQLERKDSTQQQLPGGSALGLPLPHLGTPGVGPWTPSSASTGSAQLLATLQGAAAAGGGGMGLGSSTPGLPGFNSAPSPLALTPATTAAAAAASPLQHFLGAAAGGSTPGLTTPGGEGLGHAVNIDWNSVLGLLEEYKTPATAPSAAGGGFHAAAMPSSAGAAQPAAAGGIWTPMPGASGSNLLGTPAAAAAAVTPLTGQTGERASMMGWSQPTPDWTRVLGLLGNSTPLTPDTRLVTGGGGAAAAAAGGGGGGAEAAGSSGGGVGGLLGGGAAASAGRFGGGVRAEGALDDNRRGLATAPPAAAAAPGSSVQLLGPSHGPPLPPSAPATAAGSTVGGEGLAVRLFQEEAVPTPPRAPAGAAALAAAATPPPAAAAAAASPSTAALHGVVAAASSSVTAAGISPIKGSSENFTGFSPGSAPGVVSPLASLGDQSMQDAASPTLSTQYHWQHQHGVSPSPYSMTAAGSAVAAPTHSPVALGGPAGLLPGVGQPGTLTEPALFDQEEVESKERLPEEYLQQYTSGLSGTVMAGAGSTAGAASAAGSSRLPTRPAGAAAAQLGAGSDTSLAPHPAARLERSGSNEFLQGALAAAAEAAAGEGVEPPAAGSEAPNSGAAASQLGLIGASFTPAAAAAVRLAAAAFVPLPATPLAGIPLDSASPMAPGVSDTGMSAAWSAAPQQRRSSSSSLVTPSFSTPTAWKAGADPALASPASVSGKLSAAQAHSESGQPEAADVQQEQPEAVPGAVGASDSVSAAGAEAATAAAAEMDEVEEGERAGLPLRLHAASLQYQPVAFGPISPVVACPRAARAAPAGAAAAAAAADSCMTPEPTEDSHDATITSDGPRESPEAPAAGAGGVTPLTGLTPDWLRQLKSSCLASSRATQQVLQQTAVQPLPAAVRAAVVGDGATQAGQLEAAPGIPAAAASAAVFGLPSDGLAAAPPADVLGRAVQLLPAAEVVAAAADGGGSGVGGGASSSSLAALAGGSPPSAGQLPRPSLLTNALTAAAPSPYREFDRYRQGDDVGRASVNRGSGKGAARSRLVAAALSSAAIDHQRQLHCDAAAAVAVGVATPPHEACDDTAGGDVALPSATSPLQYDQLDAISSSSGSFLAPSRLLRPSCPTPGSAYSYAPGDADSPVPGDASCHAGGACPSDGAASPVSPPLRHLRHLSCPQVAGSGLSRGSSVNQRQQQEEAEEGTEASDNQQQLQTPVQPAQPIAAGCSTGGVGLPPPPAAAAAVVVAGGGSPSVHMLPTTPGQPLECSSEFLPLDYAPSAPPLELLLQQQPWQQVCGEGSAQPSSLQQLQQQLHPLAQPAGGVGVGSSPGAALDAASTSRLLMPGQLPPSPPPWGLLQPAAGAGAKPAATAAADLQAAAGAGAVQVEVGYESGQTQQERGVSAFFPESPGVVPPAAAGAGDGDGAAGTGLVYSPRMRLMPAAAAASSASSISSGSWRSGVVTMASLGGGTASGALSDAADSSTTASGVTSSGVTSASGASEAGRGVSLLQQQAADAQAGAISRGHAAAAAGGEGDQRAMGECLEVGEEGLSVLQPTLPVTGDQLALAAALQEWAAGDSPMQWPGDAADAESAAVTSGTADAGAAASSAGTGYYTPCLAGATPGGVTPQSCYQTALATAAVGSSSRWRPAQGLAAPVTPVPMADVSDTTSATTGDGGGGVCVPPAPTAVGVGSSVSGGAGAAAAASMAPSPTASAESAASAAAGAGLVADSPASVLASRAAASPLATGQVQVMHTPGSAASGCGAPRTSGPAAAAAMSEATLPPAAVLFSAPTPASAAATSAASSCCDALAASNSSGAGWGQQQQEWVGGEEVGGLGPSCATPGQAGSRDSGALAAAATPLEQQQQQMVVQDQGSVYKPRQRQRWGLQEAQQQAHGHGVQQQQQQPQGIAAGDALGGPSSSADVPAGGPSSTGARGGAAGVLAAAQAPAGHQLALPDAESACKPSRPAAAAGAGAGGRPGRRTWAVPDATPDGRPCAIPDQQSAIKAPHPHLHEGQQQPQEEEEQQQQDAACMTPGSPACAPFGVSAAASAAGSPVTPSTNLLARYGIVTPGDSVTAVTSDTPLSSLATDLSLAMHSPGLELDDACSAVSSAGRGVAAASPAAAAGGGSGVWDASPAGTGSVSFGAGLSPGSCSGGDISSSRAGATGAPRQQQVVSQLAPAAAFAFPAAAAGAVADQQSQQVGVGGVGTSLSSLSPHAHSIRAHPVQLSTTSGSTLLSITTCADNADGVSAGAELSPAAVSSCSMGPGAETPAASTTSTQVAGGQTPPFAFLARVFDARAPTDTQVSSSSSGGGQRLQGGQDQGAGEFSFATPVHPTAAAGSSGEAGAAAGPSFAAAASSDVGGGSEGRLHTPAPPKGMAASGTQTTPLTVFKALQQRQASAGTGDLGRHQAMCDQGTQMTPVAGGLPEQQGGR